VCGAGLSRLSSKRVVTRCGPWFLLSAALLWLYGPRLLAHMQLAFGSNVLNDDMRIQLPYFYHYADKSLFNDDVIGRYHADGTGELFRAIYCALAPHVDVMVLAKGLSYVTLLLTAAGLAVAAARLGGKPAAFAAACFALGSYEFIDRMVGGMPRAFAYPCMAWCLAALAWGRIRTLAVLSALGAGFYPLLPVIGGFTLAIVLLVMQRRDRGSARTWSLQRRLVVLALTLLGALVLLVPFALRVRQYGAVIHVQDFAAFPEAGPGGRLHDLDRGPAAPFFELAENTGARTLGHGSVPFWPAVHEQLETRARREVFFAVLALLCAAGVLRAGLARGGRHFRRVAAFALAVFVGFQLAALVDPSLVPSSRYVRYGVPPLLVAVVPSAMLGLLPRRFRLPGRLRRLTAPLWVGSFTAVLLALLGTYSSRAFGYDVRLQGGERGIAAAIGRLPPNALVAGWPEGFMDDVTSFSKRAAFISYQTYMPYNQRMTLAMRARAIAVIDAYYSPDLAPLRRLRDEFHVTHFLLEPSRLRKRAHLFRPLNREIAARAGALAAGEQENALAGDLGDSVVYRDGRYELLDLSKL
jgi:hypothetical protein